MEVILTGQSMKISTEIFQKIDFNQSNFYTKGFVERLAKIVVMKTSRVFDIVSGAVNALSPNGHWHKKLNRGILEVSLVLVVEM